MTGGNFCGPGSLDKARLGVRRLHHALQQIRICFPEVDQGPIEIDDQELACAALTLPDGSHLVLGPDRDVPEVLFEVVRLVRNGVPRLAPGSGPGRAPGCLLTGKLTTHALLELLLAYLHEGAPPAARSGA